MKPICIAIDGPASSGKGTVARAVARQLGFRYIDTGAMYRAVALMARLRGVAWSDPTALATLARGLRFDFPWDGELLRVVVDGHDVTAAIRADEVSRGSSEVSAHPSVREALLGLQQALGAEGAVVMDGRDIGTVVLPAAEVKLFLDASLEERARRRHDELLRRGEVLPFGEVRDALALRDQRDRERDVSPLRPAKDALYVDSTSLSPVEVVARILGLARERGAG